MTYQIKNPDEKFDYVLFTESAQLMSNDLIIMFVNHIRKNLLKPDGNIIFINNLVKLEKLEKLENCGSNMEKLKPYFKYMIGIDFDRTLSQLDFEFISLYTHTHMLKPKLINCMKLFNILDYNVEQYKITLVNTNKKTQ